MTEGDRREIAHIVASILDSRLKDLERSIAGGIAEMLDQLADMFNQRTNGVAKEIVAERERRIAEEDAKRRPAGFR